jgi:hypothetical protein
MSITLASEAERPPLIPDDQAGMWRSLYPDVHTDRQHQARYLAMAAVSVPGLQPISGNEFPSPTWLVDWAGENRGKRDAIKRRVLEQLGRMSRAGFNEESMRNFAAAPESAGLTAKEAATRLRSIRLELQPRTE